MSLPKKIFFDESGFTGNNLLNSNQAFFSYGSVQVEDDEATEVVKEITCKHHIQSRELKGTNLLKHYEGQKALIEIFTRFNGRMKVFISEKKYALAVKFFEYVFEPVLQQNNPLFYEISFHKFISCLLYYEFVARSPGAEKIFNDFEKLMRSDSAEAANMFFSTTCENASDFLCNINQFINLNQSAIKKEWESYAVSGIEKWILDLTTTALFSLLAEYGRKYEQITVICDNSKPLSTYQHLFNIMINRKEKNSQFFNGKENPITFNLSGPIKLANSKNTPGLQIADCIASSFAYLCNNYTEDNNLIKWMKKNISSDTFFIIGADPLHINLNRAEVKRNVWVFDELLERSRNGLSLLDGISEFIIEITCALNYVDKRQIPIGIKKP